MRRVLWTDGEGEQKENYDCPFYILLYARLELSETFIVKAHHSALLWHPSPPLTGLGGCFIYTLFNAAWRWKMESDHKGAHYGAAERHSDDRTVSNVMQYYILNWDQVLCRVELISLQSTVHTLGQQTANEMLRVLESRESRVKRGLKWISGNWLKVVNNDQIVPKPLFYWPPTKTTGNLHWMMAAVLHRQWIAMHGIGLPLLTGIARK